MARRKRLQPHQGAGQRGNVNVGDHEISSSFLALAPCR
jgi:hypothetical protein